MLPDNWQAVQLFDAMSTQWMPLQTGLIGLRYEAFQQVRLAFGVADSDWPDLFQAMRVMEQEALSQLRAAHG